MKEYLTIKETADALGMSSQTLRNWEKKGALIPYRNPINNYRMYKISEVENFVENMRMERQKRGKFKVKIVSVKD